MLFTHLLMVAHPFGSLLQLVDWFRFPSTSLAIGTHFSDHKEYPHVSKITPIPLVDSCYSLLFKWLAQLRLIFWGNPWISKSLRSWLRAQWRDHILAPVLNAGWRSSGGVPRRCLGGRPVTAKRGRDQERLRTASRPSTGSPYSHLRTGLEWVADQHTPPASFALRRKARGSMPRKHSACGGVRYRCDMRRIHRTPAPIVCGDCGKA